MFATLSNWFQLLFSNYFIKLKFVCVCLIVVVSGQSFFIPDFNVLVTVYPFLINFPLFKLFSTSTRPYCGISLLLFYENFPRFIQLVSESLVTYAIATHPIRSRLLSPSPQNFSSAKWQIITIYCMVSTMATCPVYLQRYCTRLLLLPIHITYLLNDYLLAISA